MPRAPQAVALVPHPSTPSAAVRSVLVEVQRRSRQLSLRYVLAGELDRLRIPAPRPSARRDRLWRHTCFELFVASDARPAYQEFNFSPSGEWAAYAFTGYRSGAAPLECAPPSVRCGRSQGELALYAELGDLPDGALRLGVCAVVEEAQARLTYWALRHPWGRPDFHDPACFALALDEARH